MFNQVVSLVCQQHISCLFFFIIIIIYLLYNKKLILGRVFFVSAKQFAALLIFCSFVFAVQKDTCVVTVPLKGEPEKSKALTISFLGKLSTDSSYERQTESDQFFTFNIESFDKVLKNIDSVQSYSILEIGSGTGIISNSILNKKPKKLIVNEIDPKICYALGSNVDLIKKDFREINVDTLNIDNREYFGLISNPPYNLLLDIRRFIDRENIKNVILIVPAWRYTELFIDFEIVGALKNEDFLPSAKSENDIHLIIKKGFDHSIKKKTEMHQVTIGRQKMSLLDFYVLVKKKFNKLYLIASLVV